MLTLPIKKKWFDMIASGEKKEEYRDIKPYYSARLEKYMGKKHFLVCLRNGYGADSPSVIALVKLSTGEGNTDWGAECNKKYYVLKILGIGSIGIDLASGSDHTGMIFKQNERND